jgi:hypothetical protein
MISLTALSIATLLNSNVKFIDYNNYTSLQEYFISENRRELNNIKNNKRDGDIVPSTWNIGDNGKWVAYDSSGNVVKGLIYDRSRDRYFLLDFDTGDMLYENGLYEIKGKLVHLSFSNVRTGIYGSVDSGLKSVKLIMLSKQ